MAVSGLGGYCSSKSSCGPFFCLVSTFARSWTSIICYLIWCIRFVSLFSDNYSSNSVIKHLPLERRFYARGGHYFQEVIAFIMQSKSTFFGLCIHRHPFAPLPSKKLFKGEWPTTISFVASRSRVSRFVSRVVRVLGCWCACLLRWNFEDR